MLILNVAGGKFKPLPFSVDKILPQYVLNVDTSYFTETTPAALESSMNSWSDNPDRISTERYLNMDVFEFMERTATVFDRVSIYRFLEHVTFTNVEYFIYLISTVVKKGGTIDVIVPDYERLAKMILWEQDHLKDLHINFSAHNIKLTTELLNEPSCPHASIWTQQRMKYFWELEGRFKVSSQKSGFEFDGRDIYLRSIIERM